MKAYRSPEEHPRLSAEEAALIRSDQEPPASARFSEDENQPVKPATVSAGEWAKLTDRSVFEDLYFDWQVKDE